MSFKRFKGKKNDENFPSMVKFFNNIVNITQGKTWKIKSENSLFEFISFIIIGTNEINFSDHI